MYVPRSCTGVSPIMADCPELVIIDIINGAVQSKSMRILSKQVF